MNRILTLSATLLLCFAAIHAQNERKWGLQVGFGGVSMLENSYDDGNYYESENQGNMFYVSADYYATRRLALSGGLTLEQQGLFSDYSNGIGLKTVNLAGVNAGAKYYFFPLKWVFQPYVGAAVYTNVLNLGHHRGQSLVAVRQGYPGCMGDLSYDVSCPALSFSPQIGLDLHLLSSLSLCLSYDYRFGLWGQNRGRLTFFDGPLANQTVGFDEHNNRSCVSFGLKMDFPAKPVSAKSRDQLLWFLFGWLSGR